MGSVVKKPDRPTSKVLPTGKSSARAQQDDPQDKVVPPKEPARYDLAQARADRGATDLRDRGDPTLACERLRSGEPLGEWLRDEIARALEGATKPGKRGPRIAGFRGAPRLSQHLEIMRAMDLIIARSELKDIRGKSPDSAKPRLRGESSPRAKLAESKGLTLEQMEALMRRATRKRKKSTPKT